jgi:Helicase conserved C-terminal domain
MTENTLRVPLGAWLADLPDDKLVRLLRLRPDLTQPPPGSIAALAARAQARQSVKAASDALDFLALAMLDALLVLHADTTAVPLAKLTALIGDRAPDAALSAALDALQERALVWGRVSLRVVAEAPAALPWHPGQVTLEDDGRSADEIATSIDGLDDAQRQLLDRLLSGSPIGRTRDAAPGTPPDRPVPRLLATGLLRQVDDETVILPRVVGQVLRGEEPGPVSLTEPTPATTTTTAADADAAAAGAVIDILREADLVFEILGAAPVPELRSGGLGVREVKRLTKATGIAEHRLGLILEISAAAGLIAVGLPRPEPLGGDGPYWAPTMQADRFIESPIAARWHLLATTWLDLPSRPGLTGRRGADNKPIAALSDALFSTAAPLDRRLLLGLLAELPVRAGLLAEEASRMLLWRRPRWSLRLQPGPVGELFEEATALGLVGRGALTSPARALISESGDDPVAAMNRILPAPIDHFLLQADLTVVVPGPLRRELSDQLAELAVVESAGAAMVYRISEASIRRAYDIGHTAGALHAFFQKNSKTPVPQGLTYLIDDVARRHGQLRVGIAASFVRCDDTAMLAQVAAAPLADAMQLRLLAPTVAVAQAPIADVLAALRDAGFAPAAEDATGAIVDLRPRGARITDAPHRRSFRGISPPATQTLEAIVATLRQVAATPPATRVDAGTAVLLLQQAVRDQASVVMGYVDPAGVATQRVVSPISVRGGQLMAFDPASGRVRDFAVHRVTSVVSIDDD